MLNGVYTPELSASIGKRQQFFHWKTLGAGGGIANSATVEGNVWVPATRQATNKMADASISDRNLPIKYRTFALSQCYTVYTLPHVGSGRCRISPPRFLAECCKRQLNQVKFVVLYFKLSTFFWFVLSLFICIFLYCFVCQYQSSDWLWIDRLRNDLYCVEWGVKLYSIQLIRIRAYTFLYDENRPPAIPMTRCWLRFSETTEWRIAAIERLS